MTSGMANGERESFRRFLYEQGRQPSTIDSYIAEVEKFIGRGRFLHERISYRINTGFSIKEEKQLRSISSSMR